MEKSTIKFTRKEFNNEPFEWSFKLDPIRRFLNVKGMKMDIDYPKNNGVDNLFHMDLSDYVADRLLFNHNFKGSFTPRMEQEFERELHMLRMVNSAITGEFKHFYLTEENDKESLKFKVSILMYLLLTTGFEMSEFVLRTYKECIENHGIPDLDNSDVYSKINEYDDQLDNLIYGFEQFNTYDRTKEVPRTILSTVGDSSVFYKGNFDIFKQLVTSIVCIPYHTFGMEYVLEKEQDFYSATTTLRKVYKLIDKLNTLLERITPIY